MRFGGGGVTSIGTYYPHNLYFSLLFLGESTLDHCFFFLCMYHISCSIAMSYAYYLKQYSRGLTL